MQSIFNITSDTLFQVEESDVIEYTITNTLNGFSISVLNLGCTITKVLTKDTYGEERDVILGYKDYQQYITNPLYFNSVVGRMCGRISECKFVLNGVEYILQNNSGNTHLHGGIKGLSHRIWKTTILNDGFEFSYKSPHLEEGYPANTEFVVQIRLLENDAGYITDICGFPDRETILNLNTHEYWNLAGHKNQNNNTFEDHELKLYAESFLNMNPDLTPSGEILSVDQHDAFNFSSFQNLSDNRKKDSQFWGFMQGFDHSFVINQDSLEKQGVKLIQRSKAN
jgi:aldose 1-epimerase